VGANRALSVVALQALLMSGVRNYRDCDAVAAQAHRILATAASLDYVLMLVTDTAGVRIPADDAQRAIHDGMARAVDDALVLLRVIAALDDVDAQAFAREGVRTVRTAMQLEALADDARSFALIVHANDLAS